MQIRRVGNNIIYGWPGATETDMEELLAFYNEVDDDDAQPTDTLPIAFLENDHDISDDSEEEDLFTDSDHHDYNEFEDHFSDIEFMGQHSFDIP